LLPIFKRRLKTELFRRSFDVSYWPTIHIDLLYDYMYDSLIFYGLNKSYD